MLRRRNTWLIENIIALSLYSDPPQLMRFSDPTVKFVSRLPLNCLKAMYLTFHDSGPLLHVFREETHRCPSVFNLAHEL